MWTATTRYWISQAVPKAFFSCSMTTYPLMQNRERWWLTKTQKSVYFKISENQSPQVNNWVLMSVADKGVLPLETNISEENTDTNGVIIGADTSDAPGVLVLESATKAMILPKGNNPAANIPNPIIGTICFDTASNSFAIFDGQFWNFWK